MPPHICSREDCPPVNTYGPKANCIKCHKTGFLLCHDFQKHGADSKFVKITLPIGSKLILSTSSMNWVCPSCETAGIVVTENGPMTSETSTSSGKQKPDKAAIFNALNEIKSMIKENARDSIRMNETVVEKLDEIGPAVVGIVQQNKSFEQKLDWQLNKQGTQNARDLANELFRRPAAKKTGNPTVYPAGTPNSRPSYSTILQTKTPVMSQPTTSMLMSGKRRRTTELLMIDNSTSQTVNKVNVPSPQQGTKNVQIGKPVEARKIPPKKVNPLTKSVWVSGFHPDTTTDEIANYITENTAVTDKTKFYISKLVKKDHDITKMTFISFKIDVSPEDFDVLCKRENWPERNKVREFVKLSPPKSTLNEFMPTSLSPSSSPVREAKIKKTNL